MTTKHLCTLLFATLAGCVTEGVADDDALVDDLDDGKADVAPVARSFYCRTADTNTSVKVRITPNGDTFDIEASSAKGSVFSLVDQRPSLNVEVEDGTSTVPREFLDFRPRGLEAIPVTALPRLDLPLATGPKALVYADATTTVRMSCTVSGTKLLAMLGIAPVRALDLASVKAVGFDIDDTLLFSTPTFARGFATGGAPTPTDAVFWTQTNGCDLGCAASVLTLPDGTTKQLPGNVASTVKAKALEVVEYHRSLGHEVYAITARPDINGDPLRDYLVGELGLDRDHIFFEPDVDQPGNPAGKTDRIKSLALDVFYGDADSDITDARKAGARPVRFQRSPKSSNRKEGRLNKYHPGYYGETILRSYE